MIDERLLKDPKTLTLALAWHYLGTPYIWGGDDPQGFDCSGFIIELLKSNGILPANGDWTAQGLFNRFQNSIVDSPAPHLLVFYGKGLLKITHVEYSISNKYTIGASGGDSRTTTVKNAGEQNGFIKIRPLFTRKDIKAFIDPYKYTDIYKKGSN